MMGRRIVFDLEWNQDYCANQYDYYGFPERFRGEIVQIGAVCLEDMQPFNLILRPKFFPRLHEQVAGLTGLRQQDVDGGVEPREGLRRFLDWCGEGAVLLQWSGCDVLVLKQNLYLYGLGEEFPAESYDIQRMFYEQLGGDKPEPSLMEAVERLGIPRKREYHDALADAGYTAEVLGRLDLKKGINKAKKPLRALRRYGEKWGEGQELRLFTGCLSRESWRLSPGLCRVECPVCKGLLEEPEHWQKSPDNRGWYGLCRCPHCADSDSAAAAGVVVRWKGSQTEQLYSFVRGVSLPDGEMLAEWQRRLAAARKRRGKQSCPQVTESTGRLYRPLYTAQTQMEEEK